MSPRGAFATLSSEGLAKGSEKKGTTKNTKSTKKSVSFPLWPSCSSWFKAFMLFATPSKEGTAKDPEKKGTTKSQRAQSSEPAPR